MKLQNNNRIKLGVPNEEGQLSIMFARGGPRKGAGRKGIGTTKKVSLTLPEALWDKIEECRNSACGSQSEVIRGMIEFYFSKQN
jgi:hypothetical protein